MRVLIACEFSGVVRNAFTARGHDAWSCDLLPNEHDRDHHYWCDVRKVLDVKAWDLMIAHPPCTYLSSSGLHWNKRREGRTQKTEEALEFVRLLLDAPIPMIALENPMGCISTRIRPYDQVLQPYEFGEDASKQTCLWLKGLSPLKPGSRVQGRWVWNAKRRSYVERWSNQTDSGQNRLGPSETRGQDRAVTYGGIAAAMAEHWGRLALQEVA